MNQRETTSPFSGERAKLERQLEKLEQKRQAVMSALEGVVEAERRLAALDSPEVGEVAAVRSGQSDENGGLDGQEPSKRYMVIARVLREAGRPLTVPEISAEMARLGDPKSNKNLRDIIHAICRRKPDVFQRSRLGGRVVWRLRDSPHPATGNEGAGRNGRGGVAADSSRNPVVGDLTGMTVAEAARAILQGNGNRPLHFTELADEMQRRGYKSGRSTPFRANSVGTILNHKRDQFENAGGGKFKLVKT